MKEERVIPTNNLAGMQNQQNLDQITRRRKVFYDEFLEEANSVGILPEVADRMWRGIKVINCYSCNTPNMYKTNQNLEKELYKCEKCGETHVE